MFSNSRLDMSKDLSKREDSRVGCNRQLKGFIFPTEFSRDALLES